MAFTKTTQGLVLLSLFVHNNVFCDVSQKRNITPILTLHSCSRQSTCSAAGAVAKGRARTCGSGGGGSSSGVTSPFEKEQDHSARTTPPHRHPARRGRARGSCERHRQAPDHRRLDLDAAAGPETLERLSQGHPQARSESRRRPVGRR